ncbi:MAG: crossover junction endodeoxyribonuclease RuvC [Thermoanaerobaculia bacterium]|nr:crossover junction endodeoxyribonuclease RuvC [Thermoanaerobaculia bacterium]
MIAPCGGPLPALRRIPGERDLMLILGLDPGSLHTGYGLIDCRAGTARAVAAGRWSAPPKLAVADRLKILADGLDELLQRFRPDFAALERPFHGVNSRSVIVLAEARGALLVTLARGGLRVEEYSPAEVKSAVTGSGRAEKGQVARMVGLLLGVATGAFPADATDALAVALCSSQRQSLRRLTEPEGVPK